MAQRLVKKKAGGRAAIQEALTFTPKLRELIRTGGVAAELTREARKEGFRSIHDAATDGIQSGEFDIKAIKQSMPDFVPTKR